MTVNTIDRDGVTNGTTYGFVVYLARHETGQYYGGGTFGTSMRGALPEGRYTAFSWIPTRNPAREPWIPSFTLVAQTVNLDGDGEVTLDARNGVKIAATLNGTEADGMTGTALGLAGTGTAYAAQTVEGYVAPAEPIRADELSLPGTLTSYFHGTGPVG
ncbi:hypothetical protein FHR32_007828 [Streptosporangium album]|uniref:Uncharacterized protein n=1 Tax=Streptosporangium album TaxID=47479 RepID=A0A7W7S3X9_9ACTN|nr:hypothetical protein [Streptosporangium album]MBB4943428.1 hypothetical protein [Streptosporangium album]